MRMTRKRWAVLALGAMATVAAGCGDDGGSSSTASGSGGSSGSSSAPSTAGPLVIGRVLPETGDLASLGAPMIEGVRLAIEDINAAGGVLGGSVKLLSGDEGKDEAATRDATTRVLGEGAKVMIGPASSGKVQAVIQQLSDQKIPQCSGSATSPNLSDQANAGYFIRTVPPDEAVAPIMADAVIADGHSKVAVVHRSDDYGKALADLVERDLTASGASVAARVAYDPTTAVFDGEKDQVLAASPDAVVIIGFDEAAKLIAKLVEFGVKPSQLYGSDGVFNPGLPGQVDPSNKNVIDGMKVIGAAGNKEFNDRIASATKNNFIYGGQTYDCVVLLALGAQAAGGVDDGAKIVEAAIAASRDGEKCTTFKECKKLLDEGKDIDYDGAGGDLALDSVGDPTAATYAIGEFKDGTLGIARSQDTVLGS